MKESESLFINNKWKQASGPSFSSFNPANGEIIWQGREASPEDVNKAIQSSKGAFCEWSGMLLDDRARYLRKFSELLRNAKNDFATCISLDTGKPLWEAMSEVELMINKVDISFDAFHQRCNSIVRDLPHIRSITRHRPHGVLAVLGPYNFPGHLPNGQIIPALLAGNTIVYKPSELAPKVAEKTLQLWQKAGLPPGVINLVQGGKETGQSLVENPDIQGILFTGSYLTGQYLKKVIETQNSKILVLEMGGNNPLVVGDIEDVEAAAYIVIHSAFLSSGQRCTNARRLIIPAMSKGKELINALIKMMSNITIGPYTLSPEPFMGPVISERHAKKILEAQDVLRLRGGKDLVVAKHLKPGTGLISPGLMDVTDVIDRPDEEIFGPFLQVIWVDDFQSAIQEANHTKYGLSAGLLSQKEEEYRYFYRHIQAGLINWNTPIIGASSSAPFGGIKCSGNFRPGAYYAADYSVYPVASWESPELKIPEFFPPGMNITSQ